MNQFELAMRGWRMTVAEIFYMNPDHPALVNEHSFTWQRLDKAPRFPRLNAFLRWWDETLDGKVHSVKVSVRGLVADAELRMFDTEFRLK